MAASSRILSLSLGTQTVSLAEFKTGQNGGLVLASYQTRELLADPATDSTRYAQAKLLIQEMAAASGLKGQKVNYAVSAQQVFTRFVKLPSVGEEQVDQIVTFEAQQNVPYPINEVVWDYQLVDSGDPSQVEVVIVAVKSDLLDEINDSVEQSSLQATTIDVAPMAIYNAFRYSYSDLTGCSLIIDIGSRTTNLIFIEPNKVFSRSIPNGGTSITTQIAKEFGESFSEAEKRKKDTGFVSLGGAYADADDPDVARVSKLIRNAMTRLHAEIARSISFYRSQQGGSQPVRVFVSGGSASLPYLREFFHEKFNLPVEFFNPLRNVSVASNLNPEEIGHQAHTLGEIVGLALRGTSNCPMELNLRPASVVRRQQLARRRPFLILAGLCALLALTGYWLYYQHAAKATQDVVDSLTPKIGDLKGYEGKMSKVRGDMAELKTHAAPLLKAVDDRDFWVKIIDDINSRVPADFVWVTSFEARTEAPKAEAAPVKGAPKGAPKSAAEKEQVTVLLLKGLYLQNDRNTAVVDDFVDKLSASPLYETMKDDLKRSVPNETEWAYEYEIPLVLKNPISIPAKLQK